MTRGTVLAAVVLLVGWARGGARADGPAPDPATKARLAALQARVVEWCEARKQLHKEKCPTCQGFGIVEDLRTGSHATCPRCDGRRLVLDSKAFRKLRYDMMSEAWRQRPQARDEATQAYKQADATGDAAVLGKYKVDRVELVGTRFGRGWVFEGSDSVSRESRWVGVADLKTKKETWFVYSDETDGPWDETPPSAPLLPALPSEPVPKIEPLLPAETDALRLRLGQAKTPHGLELAQRAGTTIVVSLFDEGAKSAEALDADIGRDVHPLLRAAFGALPSMDRVRLVFLANWRDKFGVVRKRPYRTVESTRADFEKIHPENLTREELLALFTLQDVRQEGEILWWK